MDENQLKYQRLFNYQDNELEYKQYRIVLECTTTDHSRLHYQKKLVVRGCCEEEIRDSTKERILSIKTI